MRASLGQPSSEAAVFRHGEQIGDYSVTRLTGRGGMAQIFAAVHVPTGRKVAIKTVAVKDQPTIAYFEREIATLRSLNHPAVVSIHDHGAVDGRPWYAMDWLEGPTLRAVLRTHAAAGCSWTPTQPTRRPQVGVSSDALSPQLKLSCNTSIVAAC